MTKALFDRGVRGSPCLFLDMALQAVFCQRPRVVTLQILLPQPVPLRDLRTLAAAQE